MRTLLLPIAVTLLVAAADATDRKLPPKFVGDWCSVDSPNESSTQTFRRGRCLRDSDGWMTVNADGFRAHESECKALSVAAVPPANYQVKFRCRGEGETWTQSYRMSLERGQLIMAEVSP